MNENIIDQVKEALGINSDYSYIKLLEKLSKKRAECHPDRFKDFEEKQAKEEEFKTLNNLLIQLKKYLEQNNRNLPTVPGFEENQDYSLQLIQAISKISDLNDEIYSLNKKIEEKESEIKYLTNKINSLEEKKYEEESDNIKLSLQEIYKSSIQGKITSGLSLLILIITQINSVKKILINIFDNQTFIMAFILCIFIVSLLNIIYKSLLKYRISYNQNKLINPNNLNDLTIHETNKWNLYFTENDIEEYIKNKMTKFDKILFWGNKEIIYKQLTNFIVLYLNQKRVIKSVEIDRLVHLFKIKSTSISDDLF